MAQYSTQADRYLHNNTKVFEVVMLSDKDGNVINTFGSASNIPIAAGLVDGYSHINKFGHTGADINGTTTIWDGSNGVYTWPTAAGVVTVASTTQGGETVVVEGLDVNYNIISEETTIGGTTTAEFYRVYRAYMVHDIGFRAWVAAQRHMGFEMDPRELTDVERAKLRNVTQWWKDNRDWRHTADIKRLSAADPAIIAEIQVSSQQDRFVAFIGNAETSAWSCPAPVQLTGLKHDTLYSVTLVNRDEKTAASRGISGLDAGTLKLSGRFLMSHGVDLPSQFPDRMWVLEGVAE